MSGIEVDVPDEPHCVYRWRRALAQRVGLSEPEIAERVAALEEYCARHGSTPSKLLWGWEERLDLTRRRRPGVVAERDLAVESFLVHNGVNVFGEAALAGLLGGDRWPG